MALNSLQPIHSLTKKPRGRQPGLAVVSPPRSALGPGESVLVFDHRVALSAVEHVTVALFLRIQTKGFKGTFYIFLQLFWESDLTLLFVFQD
jgi:hypothetical protein